MTDIIHVADMYVMRRGLVTLTVFWCSGVGHDLRDGSTVSQIREFANCCMADDLTGSIDSMETLMRCGTIVVDGSEMHLKIRVPVYFDNTSTNILHTLLLANEGLDLECKRVQRIVEELVHNIGFNVTLNMVGVGMGAIGCLQTAKLLKCTPQNQLSINILALDPIPGNSLIASRMDFMERTRARSNMDLTDVPQMNHALILYPHKPLHSIMLAAPVVPKFNDGVCVFDVILGCPRSILISDKNNTNSCHLDDWMASEIVKNFLSSHGTLLSTNTVNASFPKCTQELVAQLDVESFVVGDVETVRNTHSPGNSIEIRRISGNAYLNKIHYIMKTGNYSNDWSSRPYMYSFASQIPSNIQLNMHLSSESTTTPSSSNDHVSIDIDNTATHSSSSSFSLWSWIFPPRSNNNDDEDDVEVEEDEINL